MKKSVQKHIFTLYLSISIIVLSFFFFFVYVFPYIVNCKRRFLIIISLLNVILTGVQSGTLCPFVKSFYCTNSYKLRTNVFMKF